MIKTIKKVYALFSPQEQRYAILLFIPMVLSALIDVIGIAFVMPFIALVINPDVALHSHTLSMLYQFFHFSNVHSFLIALGFLILAILILGNAINSFSTWLMLNFSHMQNYVLSKKLLDKYLRQPYVFFLNENTSALSKNILAEVGVVVTGILVPGMQMLAKFIAIFFIVVLLLVIQPKLAIAVTVILGGIYVAIFCLVKHKLAQISRENVTAQKLRYKAASEGFGGIKDIKLLGNERTFLDRYSQPAQLHAQHLALSQVISLVPRYALETVAFGGILVIVLYLLSTHRQLSEVFALLSLFAFAGYRLMPCLQYVFAAMTNIRANLDALDILYNDLKDYEFRSCGTTRENLTDLPILHFHQTLALNDLHFTYPYSEKPTINGVNLSIQANTTVGFVGETGAGKTTLIDVVLGLLIPDAGYLSVDGMRLNETNTKNWQQNLGYVPQHIYLCDDTVASNIAFGIPHDAIDLAHVERAAKIAKLHDFIQQDLPLGYQTLVGERGIRLSGGQIQRIGIARALYRDPQVLVLDEATSSLDGITENAIMDAITQLNHTKTILIIAHRLTTVKECDVIYLLDKGVVVDQGSYQHLLEQNSYFRKMAKVV